MNKKYTAKNISPLDISMMLLSIVAVILVLVRLLVKLDAETASLLYDLDSFICYIFLTHLGYGFILSKNKWQFLKVHWIDILASIPMAESLRYARLFQIFRIIRVLQQTGHLLKQLQSKRQETTIASILLFLVVVVTAGSTAILTAEGGLPESNIQSAGDAIWWSVVTVSTVGYGDYYPVTTLGKIIAAMMIVSGVSLFGAISGFMASIMVKPKSNQVNFSDNPQLIEELNEQSQQQEELITLVKELKQEVAELKQQLKK